MLHRPHSATPLLLAVGLSCLLGLVSLARAQAPDPSLLLALDEIWQLERPGISTLSDRFERKDGSTPARFETEVRDALAYVHVDAESAEVEYARKRFPANASPWGALPRIAPSSARLVEVTLPRKRYLLLSGTGEGLFGIGDWQRFGFLHVVDVSQRWAPVHYPLVAEAGLRERVIGRLPGSPVLNYLRLVPARWRDASTVERYEVLVYALNPKGPERVKTPEGQLLAFSLSRDEAAARWVLAPLAQTLIADARDAAGAAFSAPPSPSERADLAGQVAASPAAAAPAAGSVSADAMAPAGAAPSAAPNVAGSAVAEKVPATPVVDAPQTAADAAAEDAEVLAKRKAKEDAEQAASEAAGSTFKKKLPGGL